MALINIGMTQEQIEESLKPAPAARYEAIFKGFIENQKAASDAEKYLFPTANGGKMLKGMFQLMSPDPAQNGKIVVVMAMPGYATFANMAKILPGLVSGTSIDTDAAVGTVISVEVSIREYLDKETGEKRYSNDIKKFYAA